MIKELFILIRMLFGSKPKDVEDVELFGAWHFPFKGYKYLMWCGRIIFRLEALEQREREWKTESFRINKNHELIHLAQAKACGSWVKYYWRYFVEWLKGNPLINPASSAYYTIPFEVEAYANQENMDYWKNYNGNNLGRYTLKNRKKTFRAIGKDNWLSYIKRL